VSFVNLQEYCQHATKKQTTNYNALFLNDNKKKTETFSQADIALFKAYINEARERFPNKRNNKSCIKATVFLLPYIQQTFSDAKRYDFVVSDDDGRDLTFSQHAIILANENTIVIDSQLEQFRDLLELPEDFVQMGIYDADTYWSWVPNKKEVLI